MSGSGEGASVVCSGRRRAEDAWGAKRFAEKSTGRAGGRRRGSARRVRGAAGGARGEDVGGKAEELGGGRCEGVAVEGLEERAEGGEGGLGEGRVGARVGGDGGHRVDGGLGARGRAGVRIGRWEDEHRGGSGGGEECGFNQKSDE